MSNIHYFQRYAQPENVATNNTLLLLSRLYNYSPLRFNEFMQRLFGDEITVGVEFHQQVRRIAGGTPDGLIKQTGFEIFIETKRDGGWDPSQPKKYGKQFDEHSAHFLLLLDSHDVPEAEILSPTRKHFKNEQLTIHVVGRTFKSLIDDYRSILEERDYDMKTILDDYEDCCNSAGLLPKDDRMMRKFGSPYSFDDNFKYGIYYQSAAKGYSPFSYVGLYKDKSIQAVGKLVNIVEADYIDGNLIDSYTASTLTKEQKDRIVGIIDATPAGTGWDIRRNHRFFVVEKFFSTNYRKTSPRGMFGTRLADLTTILKQSSLPPTSEIADRLKEHTWT